MTTLKLFNSRSSIDRTSCKNFKQLKQFYFQNQIATIMIVLLTICASCNAPKTEATTGNTTAIVAATTIDSSANKEQAFNHFLKYKASSIATGDLKNEKKKKIDSIKANNRSNSNAKIRSNRKSYPGMINGNSIVSRPNKEQIRGERKTIDMEQIVGRPGSGIGAGGDDVSIEEDGGVTGAGSRSKARAREGGGEEGGVIDFGNSVGQYATFAVQDEEDEAKELFVKKRERGENEKLVKQIGLENGYNDNIWKSNINSNSENNGQTNSNNNNNDNIDNHRNSYRSFSTRRKRFQDSDRLRISDISSDENSENSYISSIDESDSSDSSEKVTTTTIAATASTSTSTSNTLFSSASSIKIDTSKLKCRVERNFYLDFEIYKHYSCAICYTNMPHILFTRRLQFDKKSLIWLEDFNDRRLLPNETETIRSTFKTEGSFKNWQECCTKALECCVQNSIYLPKTHNEKGDLIDEENSDKCPATWDGLACWLEAPAGTIAHRECPDHGYYLDFVPICRGQVTKQCFSNGSWFVRHDHEWSNYSQCSGETIYGTRLLIASVWHLVSVIIIGPALIVLSKLPNRGGSKRVRILSNLLFWLLLNGLLAATYKIGIIGGIFQRTEANPEANLDTPPVVSSSSSSSSPSSSLSSNAMPSSNNTSSLITPSVLGSNNAANTLVSSLSQQMLIYDDDNVAKSLDRNKRHISNSVNLSNSFSFDKNLKNSNEEEFFDLWRQRLQRSSHWFLSNQKYICDSDEGEDEGLENNEFSYNNDKIPNRNSKGLGKNKIKGDAENYNLNETTKINKSSSNNASKRASILSDSNSTPTIHRHHNNNQNHHSHHHRSQHNHPIIDENVSKTKNELLHPLLDDQNIPSTSTSSENHFSSSSSAHLKSTNKSRCKRQVGKPKKKPQSPLVVFICWIFTVGIRITRLLGYAWMFTGAVYLCSVLHFAPAEPPALFIKWLMYLTNGFPVVIGLTYVIARTIHEPSPLNILVKVPYYQLIGDTKQVENLWSSQLACWTVQSKYDYIEEIADAPNYVLVILNGVLFVVTLIIMCRITRPGSTRPDMSPGDYFKAAGTLVLLYGAHYALLAYRPPEESCIIGQVMHYSFLFVDGIQGIAVSYVFCYRTQEGREIIHKWCTSLRGNNVLNCCRFLRKKPVQIITSRNHGSLRASNRSNQSTRSTNSACNGNDPATELININNSRMASQF